MRIFKRSIIFLEGLEGDGTNRPCRVKIRNVPSGIVAIMGWFPRKIILAAYQEGTILLPRACFAAETRGLQWDSAVSCAQ